MFFEFFRFFFLAPLSLSDLGHVWGVRSDFFFEPVPGKSHQIFFCFSGPGKSMLLKLLSENDFFQTCQNSKIKAMFPGCAKMFLFCFVGSLTPAFLGS